MSMRPIAISLSFLLALLMVVPVSAANGMDADKTEDVNNDLQHKLRLGYSIGATAPLGMPASIRSLEAYYPTPSFMLGRDVSRRLWHQLGVQSGIYVEYKAMNAEVTTQGYRMKVKMDADEMEGYYTGHVRQKVHMWMFTVPLQLTFDLNPSVSLKAGPYVSWLFDKNFSGYAANGYLRQDDPTGPRVNMGVTKDERATYDFSNDMRNWQFGVSVGADWQICRQLGLSLDLCWGLTGIMKSDFKTVDQTLYPIYGTMGIFYKLK